MKNQPHDEILMFKSDLTNAFNEGSHRSFYECEISDKDHFCSNCMNKRIFSSDYSSDQQKKLMCALLDFAIKYSVDTNLVDQSIFCFFCLPEDDNNKISDDEEFFKKVAGYYTKLANTGETQIYISLPKPRHFERECVKERLFNMKFQQRCGENVWEDFYLNLYYSILPQSRHHILKQMIKVSGRDNKVLRTITKNDLGIDEISHFDELIRTEIEFGNNDFVVVNILNNKETWNVGKTDYVKTWIECCKFNKRVILKKFIEKKFRINKN